MNRADHERTPRNGPSMISGFGCCRARRLLPLRLKALGTQSSPPNQVLIDLSLFLTLHVMEPVLDTVYNDAYMPLAEQKITFNEALDCASPPLKTFMLKQTRENDIVLFSKLGKHAPVSDAQELPLRIIVPAFLTSELKTAF